MGKYIKKFDTHSDYEDFIQTEDFILPNVSYCVDNIDVHYNPIFWAYEYEPGRFIAGEILNDILYLYAPTGSGNKWVFDTNGVVLENISYSPYLQDTMDAINERFGTSFRDEDDKDSDFTIGETVPDWDRYKKIETSYKYAVDLGLPSGTLWATMNVGANSPTDYGLYFAWGETQGYADASTKAFNWSDYKFNPSGDGSTMSKYNATDGKTVLDIEDDAVAANWGGSWHMPTEAQFQELLNTANCTNAWTTVDGVNGRLFTSVTNGNTLFIPAAGNAYNGSMYGVGFDGYVWSSSLYSSNVSGGRFLYFGSNNVSVVDDDRCCGWSVRGVVG